MQRLQRPGSLFIGSLSLPNLKRKVSNSWSAVQDTYFSSKEIFERHRVVFTISTSIASIATAWAGYSLRYIHQTRIDDRLSSIENAMKNKYHLEHEEVKKIVGSGSSVSIPACVASATTSLIIGYALGWRGGKWYANRKILREQMKLMGQMKPQKWEFFKRRLSRKRTSEIGPKPSSLNPMTVIQQQTHQACNKSLS